MNYLKLTINEQCLAQLDEHDRASVLEDMQSIEMAIRDLVDNGLCRMELIPSAN